MFKEIEQIKTHRAFKKTTSDYIQYGLFIGGGCLMSIILIGLIVFGVPTLKDSAIMLFMVIGFVISMILIRKQWTQNYVFDCVTTSLNELENHSLIIELAKRFNLEILDNNVHRTIVTAKGKTSSLSMGSILTFVYSDHEILVNSRPTFGNFAIWPFYRTDLNAVLTELKKADNKR